MKTAFGGIIIAAILLVATINAMSFAVIGDWGMGGRVGGWMTEMRSADEVNTVCNKIKCNFTLSVGDNIYVGDTVRGLHDSFEDMFTSKGPFFPSIGNHDNAGPQIEYTKKNKRWKFYSSYYTRKMPIDDTGYTVQVFAVNVMDGSLGGGGQYTWLENELQKSDARWKIIFGHYPWTGSGRHKRVGTVGRIPQLMEKYGVQAYFCGHDHLLEMSNQNGRVIGMSGAMARGGMMLRGIGGSARKWTLTQPGEFNKYPTDWPGHGFITAELSPNVMTVQMWDNSGGVQYEFSVTHDWVKKVPTQPSAAQQNWPSDEVVLQAYKDELTLEKGPGGGTFFAPGGEETGGVTSPPTPAPITPAPTPAPPGSTPQPTTKLPEVTIPKLDLVTEKPQPPQPVPSYVKYAVTTECQQCSGPTSGETFTVFIEGAAVSSKSRVYLTNSVVGCDSSDHPKVLDGTKITSPTSNVVPFTSSALSTNVYVCYSMDAGKTFSHLVRQDNHFEDASFLLNPALGTTNPPAPPVGGVTPPAGSGQPQAATLNTPSPQSAAIPPPPSQDGGHHTGVVIVIGILCSIIGAFASVHIRQWQENNRNNNQAVGSA